MRHDIEFPLLGGVTCVVTDDQEEYDRLAKQKVRVFLLVELQSIMYQVPTQRDMEWVLIQKKLKPGAWVLDLKGREMGYPD